MTEDAKTIKDTKTPWYQNSAAVIALLIFLPPIGIALAWFMPWQRRNKIIASAVSGLWFLSAYIDPSKFSLATSPANSNTTAAQSETAQNLNAFGEAVEKAQLASNATQTAKTEGDWTQVVSLWGESISLMKVVPKESESYDTAQKKAVEYQANLDYANLRLAKIQEKKSSDTDALISAIRSKTGYLPQFIEWECTPVAGGLSCGQAFTLPASAWSGLSNSERSLIINYTEERLGNAIIIGRMNGTDSIYLDSVVWER